MLSSTFLMLQIIDLKVLPKPDLALTLVGIRMLMFDLKAPNKLGSLPSCSGYQNACIAWTTPSLMVGVTLAF